MMMMMIIIITIIIKVTVKKREGKNTVIPIRSMCLYLLYIFSLLLEECGLVESGAVFR